MNYTAAFDPCRAIGILDAVKTLAYQENITGTDSTYAIDKSLAYGLTDPVQPDPSK